MILTEQQDFAKKIDHTLLKPEATFEAIDALCKEALEYHFASVCVNPVFVPHVAQLLQGSDVKVCTVIGFPLGASTSSNKIFEAIDAIDNGAQEVDMVIPIGVLKSGRHDFVLYDITGVATAMHKKGALLKVIIETSLLTDDEKRSMCSIVSTSGADFIKTSTGFAGGGATVDDIKLMREHCAPHVKIKASGGIRSLQGALDLIAVGADRLGTSSGVALVSEFGGVHTASNTTGY